jgi:tetratricopeptide (TPR) repeat protein
LSKAAASSKGLEQQAMAAYEDGKWPAAADLFAEARDAFAREGNDLKAAEMSNNLCVALLQSKRHKEAIAAVEGTWDVFLAHRDDLRAAKAYGNYASAQEACGEWAAAEAAYAKAAKLLQKAGDEETRAQTLAALSRLQLRRGKPLQAVTSMQSGMEDSSRLSIGRRFLRWLLGLPSRFFHR